MRLSSRILVGCIALLGFSATAQKSDAAFTLNFGETPNSQIVFNPTDPVGGGTGTFSFVNSSGGNTIQITSGGTGAAVGLTGNITGTYTIGTITTVGPVQSAPATGSGVFSIFDGANTFTANVTWVDVTTVGTGGFLNLQGSVNLSGISYSGSNADLVTLASAINGVGTAVISFQFVPAETLTSLTTVGGSTSFSGSVTVDEDDPVDPVPAPAGLVLLASAIPVLGLRRVLRRKTLTA
jgi:hypothetical protein